MKIETVDAGEREEGEMRECCDVIIVQRQQLQLCQT